MRFAPVAFSLMLALCACRREPPPYRVSQVQVRGGTVDDNVFLGLGRQQVRSLLVTALQRDGRFRLVEAAEQREQAAWRATLELPFTRESSKGEPRGSVAEVGATLTLQSQRGGSSSGYEIAGLGEARVRSDEPAERSRAFREALERALAQVTGAAVLQLKALGQSDAELAAGLTSSDERVREYALNTLVDRRHPAAATILISRLRAPDATAVRSAIGALVEMRARTAVPDLIDLARGKDMGFVQEIVFALGEIGGEEAEAYLYTVAQGHDLPTVQAAAQQALDTLSASRKLTRSASP